MPTPPDEYVQLRHVPALYGVHPRLLTRRIKDGELDGFRDPRDRRNLLIRRSDLEELLTPHASPTRAHADQAAELAIA